MKPVVPLTCSVLWVLVSSAICNVNSGEVNSMIASEALINASMSSDTVRLVVSMPASSPRSAPVTLDSVRSVPPDSVQWGLSKTAFTSCRPIFPPQPMIPIFIFFSL